MKEEQFLFDEGVKEIMMALFSMGAMAYETDYVVNQLNRRPEPITQKIEALNKAKKIKPNTTFDQASEQLMKYYEMDKTPESGQTKSSQSHVNTDLINFIKKYEDFLPKKTWDVKQYSIGYGTKAEPGDTTITKPEALKRLVKTLEQYKNAVEKASEEWGYNWNNNQIDALTSFRFNLGSIGTLTDNGKRSNDEIAEKMLEYNLVNGKVSNGLVTRRKAEQELFLK
jgi:GH24 family phage-related lysozyme (muramidase)